MVDLKEEQKYEQLRKLGQELHIPLPEAFWTLEVFDKNGKLIQRHHLRSHSWVRNAYNYLFHHLAAKAASDNTWGAGKLNGKDTGGALKYGSSGWVIAQTGWESAGTGVMAQAGIDTFGILVGSGTNAESFEDYFLQTQIADGAGAGQLAHGAQQPHAVSYGDTTLTDLLVRYFNNNSGGNIGVNEVALVFLFERMLVTTNLKAMLARDKLPATVTVPDTGQLKVTYTVGLAYPA
ncbi:hypothetical protein ES705_38482 [subsurface metagenome]